jgi:hypothetical protein
MKPKIALLRGNAAAPRLQFRRANSVTQIRRVERRCLAEPTCTPARAVLAMTWRVNPTSGRLECHWRSDGGTASDEGVSCSHLARWAA